MRKREAGQGYSKTLKRIDEAKQQLLAHGLGERSKERGDARSTLACLSVAIKSATIHAHWNRDIQKIYTWVFYAGVVVRGFVLPGVKWIGKG